MHKAKWGQTNMFSQRLTDLFKKMWSKSKTNSQIKHDADFFGGQQIGHGKKNKTERTLSDSHEKIIRRD